MDGGRQDWANLSTRLLEYVDAKVGNSLMKDIMIVGQKCVSNRGLDCVYILIILLDNWQKTRIKGNILININFVISFTSSNQSGLNYTGLFGKTNKFKLVLLVILSENTSMVKSSEENIQKYPGEENMDIENKGEYFEWICSKCKWGARGYDKDAIMKISRRHNELGCSQFASEVESKGLRIDN